MIATNWPPAPASGSAVGDQSRRAPAGQPQPQHQQRLHHDAAVDHMRGQRHREILRRRARRRLSTPARVSDRYDRGVDTASRSSRYPGAAVARPPAAPAPARTPAGTTQRRRSGRASAVRCGPAESPRPAIRLGRPGFGGRRVRWRVRSGRTRIRRRSRALGGQLLRLGFGTGHRFGSSPAAEESPCRRGPGRDRSARFRSAG